MITDKFWCGTQEALDAVLIAQDKATQFMAGKDKDVTLDDLLPPMYHREGSVGVVHVSGPLTSGDAGFMRLFGVTGYDNVREALVKAVGDKDAKSIMLSIDSPGGSVNGVTDVARFVKAVAAIKPVTAYADTMASAAYWLGSGASHITATDTSSVGSIGIMTVHTEYSKANDQAGVTKTVLRAGEHKVLMNPHEPLTDVAKADTHAQLEYTYGIFADMAADNRGVSRAELDAKMGRGRVFIGTQAKDVGLVDSIGTYEQALAYASANAGVNRVTGATKTLVRASISDNLTATESQGPNVKPTLTPEQLAAIEAGINTEVETPASEAVTEAAETAATLNTEELDAAKAQVASLQTQLTEALASVDSGKQAAIEASEAITAFSAIVSASTKGMLIALNSPVDGIDGLAAQALLAKHKEVSASFRTKFKAGGVAATSAEAEEKPNERKAHKVNPLFAAMVQSVNAK